MDADRVQRLGGLVAMGVAMQVSSETLQTKSSEPPSLPIHHTLSHA